MADDTLDAAWAAVEALLRPTDRLVVSTLPGGGVWARVVEVAGHRLSASADADTPLEALSTLAQRLREAR